jgi:hypothetical protein
MNFQLPTADNFQRTNLSKCQELLETYPKEVVSTWAWRCAEDAEHLATTPESKEVYRIARLYLAGKATREELDMAWSATYYATKSAAYHAAPYHAAFACRAAIYATVSYRSAFYASYASEDEDIKWALYRTWLIEELNRFQSPTVEVEVDIFEQLRNAKELLEKHGFKVSS